MESLFRVGVDVGSTTIKLVVLGEEHEILYKNYARHFSEIGKALQDNLTQLRDVVGEAKFSFALTGSAGMGIAQRIGLPFVQEVVACASAVRRLIPETTTAVELGGEDAKITYFGDAPEQRMNGVCAGGTGSFIDHMASLLSTDPIGLNALAEQGKRVYAIASRCGVFAKTDIQALMNDGAAKADIALSVFQAVVNQTIGNLAQGRPIGGNVAFLGGPLHFLPELKKRFIETLKLDDEHVVDVDYGNYFVAVGAALSDDAGATDMREMEACIARAEEAAAAETRTADFTLFKGAEDYAAFRARHDRDRVKRGSLADYRGAIYIGIDAGSTTTKLVAIGTDKQLLHTSYGSNHGSPLQSVVHALRDFYAVMPAGTHIAGAMTTGYGEAIVKAALHADGELGEHAPVDLDAGQAQALDEPVVGHALGADGGVDALDPQAAEVALAGAAVAEGVDAGVGDLLLGLAVEAGALAAVARGLLENRTTLLVGVDSPLHTCHVMTP